MGHLTENIGATQSIRSIYTLIAKKFVRGLPPQITQAAWLRRSTVNEDFVPFVSDIDITILIDDHDLRSLKPGKKLPRPPLMEDVQFLSRRFLEAWMETGGFRNYQLSQWKQIHGQPLILKEPVSNIEERAFELAYEVHLVFKQLATKILNKNFDCSSTSKDVRKLSLELNRIRFFWDSGDSSWAIKKREDIPFPGELPEVYKMVDELCRSLIEELEPPLNVYNWMKAVTGEDEFGYETAISFKGHPIFVLKDPSKVIESREARKGTFLVTGAYLQMIKGIGVQEQDHLNKVARENSYYRKFSCQRLANDLIGALILEPDDIEQLYYCFFNISHFHQAMTGEFPGKWPEIEKEWNTNKRLLWQGEALERVCVTYLDHLEALI